MQDEKQGFVRTTKKTPTLTSEQRAALIRRGNTLFNSGNFDTAQKIFVTTKYTDGLIRMGDHYMKNREPLEALKMYRMAPAHDKTEDLMSRMVAVLKRWLSDEGTTEHD